MPVDPTPPSEVKLFTEELRRYLRSIPSGSITEPSELISRLMTAWPELDGGDQHSMQNDKLGRIEDVTWDPPILGFMIERHGRTVQGSSRGDLHRWEINVAQGTAQAGPAGHRQLHPRQPPLQIEPLVKRVVTAIAGHDDECLKRLPDGLIIRVQVRVLIPDDANRQTVAGRRKRFRQALESRLAELGWFPMKGRAPYTYGRREEKV